MNKTILYLQAIVRNYGIYHTSPPHRVNPVNYTKTIEKYLKSIQHSIDICFACALIDNKDYESATATLKSIELIVISDLHDDVFDALALLDEKVNELCLILYTDGIT